LHDLRVANLSEATRDFSPSPGESAGATDEAGRPVAVRAVRVSDVPGRGILNYAREVAADMIVMGTHGREGIDRLVRGSVSEYVVRRAECPVLLVPPTAESHDAISGRVVVAHDFSTPAAGALAAGRTVARALEVPLDVLHVVEVTYVVSPFGPVTAPVDYEALRERSVRLLATATAGEPYARPLARIGGAVSEVVDHAREAGAGLIVVGSHGRRGFGRLVLGSVAEGIARRAPCPVMIVPAGLRGEAGVRTAARAMAAAL
jgi:nucleotide-binding universal stress UspA family protein